MRNVFQFIAKLPAPWNVELESLSEAGDKVSAQRDAWTLDSARRFLTGAWHEAAESPCFSRIRDAEAEVSVWDSDGGSERFRNVFGHGVFGTPCIRRMTFGAPIFILRFSAELCLASPDEFVRMAFAPKRLMPFLRRSGAYVCLFSPGQESSPVSSNLPLASAGNCWKSCILNFARGTLEKRDFDNLERFVSGCEMRLLNY